MPRLLLVQHAPTEATQRLSAAVRAGAEDPALDGIDVVEAPPLEAVARDVLACDGIILGTPANFGYMSGALKHFFDTTFLAIGGALDDRAPRIDAPARPHLPFGLWIHGRYDLTGAERAVLSITGALPWRQGAPVLRVLGSPTGEDEMAAYELGGTIAALMSAG